MSLTWHTGGAHLTHMAPIVSHGVTMKANATFERYDSARDYLTVLKSRQGYVESGTSEYKAQKELADMVNQMVYEASDGFKAQVDDDLSARKYRKEHGWILGALENNRLCFEDDLQSIIPETIKELPRDGTKNCAGDRGDFEAFRIPEYNGSLLPLAVDQDSLAAAKEQVKDWAASHGITVDRTSGGSDDGESEDSSSGQCTRFEPEINELVNEVNGLGPETGENLRQYLASNNWSAPDSINIPVEEQYNSLDDVHRSDDISLSDLTQEQLDAIAS